MANSKNKESLDLAVFCVGTSKSLLCSEILNASHTCPYCNALLVRAQHLPPQAPMFKKYPYRAPPPRVRTSIPSQRKATIAGSCFSNTESTSHARCSLMRESVKGNGPNSPFPGNVQPCSSRTLPLLLHWSHPFKRTSQVLCSHVLHERTRIFLWYRHPLAIYRKQFS